MAAEHDIARDRLIEGRWLETVGTRQVDHAESAPRARTDEPSFLALDRYARIVGDFLAAARETIEKCGLTAVRDADQGETQLRRGHRRGRVHGVGPVSGYALEPGWCNSTHTLCASRRRSASVV